MTTELSLQPSHQLLLAEAEAIWLDEAFFNKDDA